MKRMLFNATQAEELRVAIVDGQKLIDLDIETPGKEQRKSNIYKGVITRIEPSLEAAFVEYGADRHGFLPFKEVARAYFRPGADVARARIQDALDEGNELIVQVDKDERGNKGAALTTFISLAGRYLVLMPNNPRGGGVSRRVEGEERNELRDVIDQLSVPQGMSVIGRTAAIGRSQEELEWDLNRLLQLWRAIDEAGSKNVLATYGTRLLYPEGNLVARTLRDSFHQDIGEILIDTEDLYEQARALMGHIMPDSVNRVKLYKDDVPLFSRFQIEHQIESAHSRSVTLPSGGAVVFDHTEALVSIDVNSARATRGADIEETAFRTNMEAAEEITRQLRLRDLGGLIVIDFIDMENGRNQRDVENQLRDSLRYDRARVQMGKISRFGLMELSRQRLRPSLGETTHNPCPRCHGTGHIRGTESTALHILRIIQEEAMKENTGAINAQVPVDVATFLLNEKRVDLQLIEARHRVSIMLIPNVRLETPNYTVTRMRHDDLNKTEPLPASYNLVAGPEDEEKPAAKPAEPAARQDAVVKAIPPQQPAPMPIPVAREPRPERPRPTAPERTGQPSFISKFFGLFKNKPAEAVPAETTSTASRPAPQDRGQRRNWQGRDQQRDGGRRDRGGERPAHQGGQRRPDSGEQHRHGGRPRPDQERHERHRNEPRRQEQGQRQQQQHQQQRGPSPAEGGRPAPAQNQHQPQGREHGEQREGRGRRRRRGGRDRDRDRTEQRQPDSGQAGGGRGQPTERERAAPPQESSFAPVAAPIIAAAAAGVAGARDSIGDNEAPYENERVREYEPPAALVSEPVPSGPGVAVAAPVQIEWPADLQQVESDPNKVSSVEQEMDSQPAAPRPKRLRQAPQAVDEGPLVQIETDAATAATNAPDQKG
jgi:ribonuclease E